VEDLRYLFPRTIFEPIRVLMVFILFQLRIELSFLRRIFAVSFLLI